MKHSNLEPKALYSGNPLKAAPLKRLRSLLASSLPQDFSRFVRTMACMAVVSSNYAQAADQSVHYYVVESNAAPFQITENGQSAGGIITQIAESLFSKLEVPLTTHVAPSKRIEVLLTAEHSRDWVAYDAKVWDSLSNGELIDVPLFDVHHALLHCNPSLKEPADLAKMHIAILKGFRYPELSAMSLDGTLSLLETRDYAQAIKLVKLARVSGFVEMDVRLDYQLQKLSDKKHCLRLSDLSNVIDPYSIYLAVNASMDSTLKQKIKDQLILMRKDGSLSKVWSQFSNRPYLHEH
jgi:polar amino acid transport system substrate-binding protein